MQTLGVTPIGPHAMRRGGAALAAQQGVPVGSIMPQGHWVSEAANSYLARGGVSK